jgi:RNA-directed DNA polymerase
VLGLEQSLGSRIVTYAGDLVILCRRGKAEEALLHLRRLMGKLKLTVNEEKTRICKVPEGEFNFLGYSFGRMYSARTGKAYLGFRPSKKSIKRIVETIHALTTRSETWRDTTKLVQKLNRTLRGCLLVPETSCEARNSFLDRALLGATVADTQAGLSGD